MSCHLLAYLENLEENVMLAACPLKAYVALVGMTLANILFGHQMKNRSHFNHDALDTNLMRHVFIN